MMHGADRAASFSPRRRRGLIAAAWACAPVGICGAMDMARFDVKDPATVFPDSPEMQRLAQAVMRDDAAQLEAALRLQPAAANMVGVESVGLLMLAVVNGKPNAVRALMRAGADPHRGTSKLANLGRPASMALRMPPSPDLLGVMLERGLDVNGGRDADGKTLAAIAVMEPDDRRLRQLIATGKADLNLADRVQATPLTGAVMSNQYGKALLLLDAGADPRVGRINLLEELVNRHDNWAPGTEKDMARRQLIQRLRAAGLSETTVMRPAPMRPGGAPIIQKP